MLSNHDLTFQARTTPFNSKNKIKMKSFIVFSAVVACAVAAPQLLLNAPLTTTWGLGLARSVAAPLAIAAPAATIVSAPTATQYHAQDELGQYSYGYAGGPSAKAEAKDALGITRGSYSYVDANGILQTVNYVSDALGFRVAATNLPVAPAAPAIAPLVGPAPVQDTPEVAAAKIAHAEAVAKAAAAAAAAPDN